MPAIGKLFKENRFQNMENSSTEHDVDMSDISDRLYAEVHYSTGEAQANSAPAADSPIQNLNETGLRIVSAHSIVSRSGPDAASKNSNRYWSGSGGQFSRPKPPRKHGEYRPSPAERQAQKSNPIPKVPSGNKPKAFTPYKSLMSDSGITTSASNGSYNNDVGATEPSVSENISGNDGNEQRPGLKETSKLIQSGGKRKNPFASAKQPASHEKRINPFSRMQKDSMAAHDKMAEKKKKADRARKKGAQTRSRTQNVVFDVYSEGDNDDDVIILPTPPPPMITIDSSDDEEGAKQRKKKPFAEPKKVKSGKQQGSRCPSPTNSTMSDDFIVQTDRGRSNVFEYVREEDLIEVNQTVDSIVRAAKSRPMKPLETDKTDFITPQKSQVVKKKKDKSGEQKSYQVGENSFAAVDVYESESSDMPESVYVKGILGKRKNVSSSSSDSTVEDFNVQKSKRLKKRKSSGSQKSSDFVNTGSSSEASNDENEGAGGPLPYLIRGEALGRVKKSSAKKLKKKIKRTLSCSENPSDNEFITKLTSIVHGESDDGEEDGDADGSKENPAESIDARDIVQNVLQKRHNRLKTVSETERVSVDREASNACDNTVVAQPASNSIAAKPAANEIASTSAETPCGDKEDEEDVIAIEPQISVIDLVDEEPSDTIADKVISEHSAKSKIATLEAENPEMGWNEEMSCFYNESWGDEHFSSRRLQKRMSCK